MRPLRPNPVPTSSVGPALFTRRQKRTAAIAGTVVAGCVLLSAVIVPSSHADTPGGSVLLGTVDAYSVLAGSAVTNTGSSVLGQDLGVDPGDAITGFPPGQALGTTHEGDAEALQAQSDLTIAYNDAAGRAPTASVAGDLGDNTFPAGVYNSTSSLGLTGPVTLDGQGDPNSVFIFQVGSTLTTASASSVVLINDAQPCNVFWQVSSSATLGTDSTFVGSILALSDITVTTATTVEGRALARNGQVTLDDNTFTQPACDLTLPTDTPTDTGSVTPTDTPTDTGSATPTDTPTDTGSVTPTDTPTDTGSSTTSFVPSSGTSSSGSGDLGAGGNGAAGNGGGAGDNGAGGLSGTDTSGQLASTGASHVVPLFGLGTLLLFAGAVIVGVATRRRPGPRHR